MNAEIGAAYSRMIVGLLEEISLCVASVFCLNVEKGYSRVFRHVRVEKSEVRERTTTFACCFFEDCVRSQALTGELVEVQNGGLASCDELVWSYF